MAGVNAALFPGIRMATHLGIPITITSLYHFCIILCFLIGDVVKIRLVLPLVTIIQQP